MKKFIFSTAIIFSISVQLLLAQKIPNKKEVLKVLKSTNAYFMNKWPDAGKSIITNRERPSNIWTRAVYYEGLMNLYKIHPEKEYYDYAVQWGQKHNWGLRNGITTKNADDQACGQTYIDLYLIDKQPERIKDIKASIDLVIKSGKVNDWTWIDAIQMGMPVFARLGKLYNDTTYYNYMYKMYMHSKNTEGGGLYNAKDGLWWRDKDFVPPYKEPNGEDCYWARGNGWVVAALVRVLEIIPENEAHRSEYLKTYHEMIKALVPIQRADGFWNVSLHDATHFGGKETSGTALFVYGMAWGVNQGILDKATYLPIITKAWNAMTKDAVQKNGFIGYMQGTGKEPKDGQPVSYTSVPDFEDYGLGCFLLAGTEVYKLKK
ncbi:glycoside hydrolase family 88 protein [Pedobacter sp. ISL-68]|uniref:glycoside hydrolase family 88/105 protein n=1 Tax=unclassified Pedobacter TaxID=2628915 RepID=UPI001BE4EDB5|nr:MULTISPECIES: glycoside hydrolase family 88 protein [unclassified Pedobacter]MBT2563872.1 glycoside hydrolase family 88 protein [Pedobacter sp. ISL-64]MBT2592722.1 glycoside hydrolase family 88 protein [Pedobacter sp. ISL-68]